MAETSSLPAVRPTREVRVVENQLTGLYDTARFEHMQRIANVMALASLIPAHLKSKQQQRELAVNETVANCFILVNQAARWNVDPFSIAPETYVVAGKLGYSGKLVAAIVNTRAGLKESLDYTFIGEGDQREVTVHGTFEAENRERIVTLKVKDAKTDNGMWTKDPDQKLIYSGATKWARRHCPEILLGVVTDDDLERIAAETATDITPRPQRQDYVTADAPAANGRIIENQQQERTETRQEVSQAADAPVEGSTTQSASSDAGAQTDETETVTGKSTEPAAWELQTIDGEVLGYDDPEDFAKAYPDELDRAHKQHGLAGLKGFIETNAAEVQAFREKVNERVGAKLSLLGKQYLLPAAKGATGGGLDLDAPISR